MHREIFDSTVVMPYPQITWGHFFDEVLFSSNQGQYFNIKTDTLTQKRFSPGFLSLNFRKKLTYLRFIK
jgi:hypothetical protein